MKQNTLMITSDRLSLGMFVQSVSGEKAVYSFPPQGLLIETEKQLKAIQKICFKVTVDLNKSSESVIKNLLTLEESEEPQLVEELHFETPKNGKLTQHHYKVPQYSPEKDEYGYKGRLIYRILEDSLIMLFGQDSIKISDFEQKLDDFIAYTAINPDVLFLESHLSSHSSTLIGICLRSIIHLSIYSQGYNRNFQFVKPIAQTMVYFALILTQLPKHQSRLQFSTDPADQAIFAHALQRQFRTLSKQYKLPLNIEKTVQHLSEPLDTLKNSGNEGSKISYNAQLINIFFLFESLQSNALGHKSLTALEAISVIKSLTGRYFTEETIEKIVLSLPVFPTGTLVKLGTRQILLVAKQHPYRKHNPKLLVLTDHLGNPLKRAKWLEAKFEYEIFKQTTADLAQQHAELIRHKVQQKMPWYKKIVAPATYKTLFQKMDQTG